MIENKPVAWLRLSEAKKSLVFHLENRSYLISVDSLKKVLDGKFASAPIRQFTKDAKKQDESSVGITDGVNPPSVLIINGVDKQ